MSVQTTIVTAEDTRGVSLVRDLFDEYAAWLAPFVDHHTIRGEIETLPAPFVAPRGILLLAADEGVACGCVGLKPHTETSCEVKRLYVRESCRSAGLGRALLVGALSAACELGYNEALVSTIPAYMARAVSMYEGLGFVPTERFEDHTHAEIGISYLSLDLPAYCVRLAGGSVPNVEA
jgi:GNAT superfamily N-acetyltransferase